MHPLFAQAIAENLTTAQRHTAHRRAAAELVADGVPAEAVAAHLLHVEPLRDPEVVAHLSRAARAALAKGAPQAAVTYQERALAEPPPADRRVEVLAELGSAQVRLGPRSGFARLREALDLATDVACRDRIALEPAEGLELASEMAAATEVLERAVGEVESRGAGDAAPALMMETELIALTRGRPETRPAAERRLARLRPHARPDTAAGCVLMANLAVDRVQDPDGGAEAVGLAEQAMAGATARDLGRLLVAVLYLGGWVLASAGELDRAAVAADRAVEQVRRQGRSPRPGRPRPAEALAHLFDCGNQLEMRGWLHPGLLTWRTDAALAAQLLGDAEQARHLAGVALDRAQRFGAPIALGVAQRAAGLVADDVDLLQVAVETLAPTAARLEHARALVDLGAALRRANRRVVAREPLGDGLDLAAGARRPSHRAVEEARRGGCPSRWRLRTAVEGALSERAARRPARRAGPVEPRRRAGPLRHDQDGRGAPVGRLPQAGDHVAGGAAGAVPAGMTGQRPRCRRRAASTSAMRPGGTAPTRRPTRSTAIERTCSACTFESRGKPVSSARSSTWNA